MVSAQLLPLSIGPRSSARQSAQKAAAAEILSRVRAGVREEVATRNAASMRGA